MHVRMQGRRPDISACVFVFKREWRGLEHASMASRGSETQCMCKRDRYSVRDKKQECVRERRLIEKQIDREIEMLARGTSASLCVRDDRRVVQR